MKGTRNNQVMAKDISERSDVLTPEQRNRCMSRIKGRNTGPELRLRKVLWRRGIRYRLNSEITGRPDLVFPKQRVAVFVDGCFWHGCPQHGSRPKANSAFWNDKIERNIERDRFVTEELQRQGWTVLRFWEHEVESNVADVADRISDGIKRRNSATVEKDPN